MHRVSTLIRIDPDVIKRIDKVLIDKTIVIVRKEKRVDLIRHAVDRELARRESYKRARRKK